MAHVGILVSKPTRTFSRGGFVSSQGWYLSFDAGLARAWTQDVELTSSEKFADLAGHVGFVDADAREPNYDEHDVGTLSYHEGSDDMFYGSPAAFYVTLRMPRADLDQLIATVANGPLLRSLNIDVPGLEYGWAPDGSKKKWDNITSPSLPLESFRLFFGEPEEEEIEPDPVPLADPGPAFTRQDLEMSRIATSSRWIAYLLVAVIIILLVRR